MISVGGIGKIVGRISALQNNMQIRIGGTDEDLAFTSNAVVGDTVTITALANETYVGLIDRVRLIDTDVDIFAERIENIDKPGNRLLLFTFQFRVVEEAA